jgi:hypothetical protein
VTFWHVMAFVIGMLLGFALREAENTLLRDKVEFLETTLRETRAVAGIPEPEPVKILDGHREENL